MPIKKCKKCENDRYANTSWCITHFKEHEKEKEKLKAIRKLDRKIQSKGFIENTRKKLHKQMWKLMSLYIRTKDADNNGMVSCYTCGIVKHYKEMDCGHFKHGRLDGDERNLKVQCSKCNRYLSGHLDVYAERLIRDYGLDWFNQLVLDANTHQGYSISELACIIRDLKTKLKQDEK
jgi:hypothetical protein